MMMMVMTSGKYVCRIEQQHVLLGASRRTSGPGTSPDASGAPPHDAERPLARRAAARVRIEGRRLARRGGRRHPGRLDAARRRVRARRRAGESARRAAEDGRRRPHGNPTRTLPRPRWSFEAALVSAVGVRGQSPRSESRSRRRDSTRDAKRIQRLSRATPRTRAHNHALCASTPLLRS